jgi:alpha-mannosidase
MTTVTDFGDFLRNKNGKVLPTRRGDWTDWWSDGMASSAYETGLNRHTHELLLASELMEAWLRSLGPSRWDAARLQGIYDQATLYDEHTWGAFSSIAAPQNLFTKSQWNRKACFAYSAAMEAHDVLAQAAIRLGNLWSNPGPEGEFNLGDLTPEEAYPSSGSSELLVINTLPWSRSAIVEEPELGGHTAPAGMLEMFFPRDVPWGGNRPATPMRRVEGQVPGWGYAFLPLSSEPRGDDLHSGQTMIENSFYRVRVDPLTGALAEWIDKHSGHNFAGKYHDWGLGQFIYERVDAANPRLVLFQADFSHEDIGTWGTSVPFLHLTVTSVKVHPPRIEHGRASIQVEIAAPGIRHAIATYWLDTCRKVLAEDWLLDKEHHTETEAVFIAFPFNLGQPQFRVDLNGIPCTPNQDELPGTVRDYYPVHRWVDVNDGARGVTGVPLDAPLVKLGGITTNRWAEQLDPEGPTLMSWALNNHWMVNFKASQGGEIPLRYRLTTHSGVVDDVAAARFATEAVTPPIVLRDRLRHKSASGKFLSIPEDAGVLLTAKPAEDGDGIVVRVQNLRQEKSALPLTFESLKPVSAHATSPIENDLKALEVKDTTITVPLKPREIVCVKIRF